MMQPMVNPGLGGGVIMPQPMNMGSMGAPGGPIGGNVGSMPQRPDNMMMMQAPFAPKSSAPMQPQSVKSRLTSIVRDKQKFLEMEENQAKRVLSDPLKLVLEENNLVTGS